MFPKDTAPKEPFELFESHRQFGEKKERTKDYCRSILWARYGWGKGSKCSPKEHKQNAFVKSTPDLWSTPMVNLPSSSFPLEMQTDYGKVLPRGWWLSCNGRILVCVWSHGEDCPAAMNTSPSLLHEWTVSFALNNWLSMYDHCLTT